MRGDSGDESDGRDEIFFDGIHGAFTGLSELRSRSLNEVAGMAAVLRGVAGSSGDLGVGLCAFLGLKSRRGAWQWQYALERSRSDHGGSEAC